MKDGLLPILDACLVYADCKPTATLEDAVGAKAAALMSARPVSRAPPQLSGKRVGLGLAGLAAMVGGLAVKERWRQAHLISIIGTGVSGFAGWPLLRRHFVDRQIRNEESKAELLKAAKKPLRQRRIEAFEEFRSRLAVGDFEVFERQADGAVRKLSSAQLQAFSADGGRILIVSTDIEMREAVPNLPRPIGELWVGIGRSRALALFCSASLIDEKKKKLFSKRVKWLENEAKMAGLDSDGFLRALGLIESLRHPKVAGLKGQFAVDALSEHAGKGAGLSLVNKLHAGSYDPFENVLNRLNLKDMPSRKMKLRKK